jgi:hypothetical protein
MFSGWDSPEKEDPLRILRSLGFDEIHQYNSNHNVEAWDYSDGNQILRLALVIDRADSL